MLLQIKGLKIKVLAFLLLILANACTPVIPESVTVDEGALAGSEVANRQNENTSEATGATIFSLAHIEQKSTGYRVVTAEQLADALPNQDFTLVNVHVPDQGSLPATDYSIPFNELEAFVAAMPDTAAPIVIYCQSGGMSSQMAPALIELGYTNLFELNGGFNAWSAAGYELLPPR